MPDGSKQFSSTFHFTAGLCTGVTSAALLQPVDLLKTRVQQAGSASLLVTLRDIHDGPGFVRGLWRGTLPSIIRTGFGSALYFTSLNALRQRFSPASRSSTSGNGIAGKPRYSNLANLTNGALARASAGFVMMPVTVIKVRYESSLYSYRSLLEASTDILSHNGARGFFAGFGATAIRDAPYAGLYVLFYEQLKLRLGVAFAKSSRSDSDPLRGSRSVQTNFASGVVAAGLATTLTNPFDSIKTRIQLMPDRYKNTIQAARLMFAKDGMRSFFDGVGLRMARKALSSGLAWTLYEELIHRAEVHWVHEAMPISG